MSNRASTSVVIGSTLANKTSHEFSKRISAYCGVCVCVHVNEGAHTQHKTFHQELRWKASALVLSRIMKPYLLGTQYSSNLFLFERQTVQSARIFSDAKPKTIVSRLNLL